MRALEFLKEWLIKRRVNNILLLVSEHVQDQARDRGVPWHYIELMLEQIPRMNQEKLEQMLHFPKFYIRDDNTWTELGCRLRSDMSDQLTLHVNTVIRAEPGTRHEVPILKL